MKLKTTVCTVDVGKDLKDLKELMLESLENDELRLHEVYGIFNGQLYAAYPWAETVNDIKLY